jgi:tetratricopeptide (TPR) repeat protein
VLDTDSIEAYADESHLLSGLLRLLHFGTLLPLALLGVWLTRSQWRRLWLLYALALTLAGAVALFYVMARYRYPLVPILALFAGAGLCAAWALVRDRAWRPLLQVLLLPAVVAVACNWPLRGHVDPRTITHFSLGSALVEARRFDEARAQFERALVLDPGFVDARYAVGQSWLEQGDPRRALVELERTLAADPDHAHARTGMGMALAALERLEEAEREFREAIRLDPRMAAAHNNLAALLLRRERPGEAAAHLREAVRAAPADPDLRVNMAKLLLLTGDAAGAAEEIEHALRLEPAHAEARRLAALLRARAAR